MVFSCPIDSPEAGDISTYSIFFLTPPELGERDLRSWRHFENSRKFTNLILYIESQDPDQDPDQHGPARSGGMRGLPIRSSLRDNVKININFKQTVLRAQMELGPQLWICFRSSAAFLFFSV